MIHRNLMPDKVKLSVPNAIIVSWISYLKLPLLITVLLLTSPFIEYLSLALIATKYFAVIHSYCPVAFPNYQTVIRLYSRRTLNITEKKVLKIWNTITWKESGQWSKQISFFDYFFPYAFHFSYAFRHLLQADTYFNLNVKMCGVYLKLSVH